MAYRQQKMEELEEKKRKREARVMAQRYEAEVAELKAKHRAEEESLASQLKTALLEKEMANGDGQRELAQRHMEEIRALRKGFKAEMQLARCGRLSAMAPCFIMIRDIKLLVGV